MVQGLFMMAALRILIEDAHLRAESYGGPNKQYPGGASVKTLYLSDLDGTLLHSNERTGEYTNHVINEMTERGMTFSYVTARSFSTAQKVTAGLTAHIPLIVYNGAFIIDNATGEIMESVDFEGEAALIIRDLIEGGVYCG